MPVFLRKLSKEPMDQNKKKNLKGKALQIKEHQLYCHPEADRKLKSQTANLQSPDNKE